MTIVLTPQEKERIQGPYPEYRKKSPTSNLLGENGYCYFAAR